MKILICGDRNWNDRDAMLDALFPYIEKNPIIIHGAARGADKMGEQIAKSFKLTTISCPAKWSKHGRSAGPIRNQEMLNECPDVVLAFHNNIAKSKGTKHMISIAKKKGIKVEVITGSQPS